MILFLFMVLVVTPTISATGASRFEHLMRNMDTQADQFARENTIRQTYDLKGQIKNINFEMQHVMDDFNRLNRKLSKMA